jgi:hypothetical protein
MAKGVPLKRLWEEKIGPVLFAGGHAFVRAGGEHHAEMGLGVTEHPQQGDAVHSGHLAVSHKHLERVRGRGGAKGPNGRRRGIGAGENARALQAMDEQPEQEGIVIDEQNAGRGG